MPELAVDCALEAAELAPCQRPPRRAGVAAAMMRAIGVKQLAIPLICIKALDPCGCEDFTRIPEPWPPRSVLGRVAGDATGVDACTRIGRA